MVTDKQAETLYDRDGRTTADWPRIPLVLRRQLGAQPRFKNGDAHPLFPPPFFPVPNLLSYPLKPARGSGSAVDRQRILNSRLSVVECFR